MSLATDIARIALDRPKLQQIVNGDAATTVATDGGQVPSLARLLTSMGAGTVRGAWVTLTAYALGEVVTSSGTAYRCVTAHTSAAAFANDLAAGKWIVHYTATSVVDTMALLKAAANTYGTILVLGYYAAGDLGGGIFRWDSASSVTDNGGTVIIPTAAPATGRWLRVYDGELDVRWFGAKGDGTTDDTTAIQAAIDATPAYGTLRFQAGTYIIGSQLTPGTDNVTIRGPALIKAKASTQFEYMLLATGRAGVVARDINFDANKDNRKASQSIRYMCAGFSACTECHLINVRAQNALGYNGGSAVALFAAGQSTRCRLEGCVIIDCGEAGLSPSKDADAIFTSGEQNVIIGCIATNCTDTGFVLESSNNGIISGCTARYCGAGAAITNANGSDRHGNVINGLSVLGWLGSVGAIQVGIPGAYAGNLLDTIVSDVTISAETPTYGGPGPAILVSGTAAFGEVRSLILSDIRIRGGVTQGILVNRGAGVQVKDAHISGTTDACIQFQNGTAHVVASSYLSGGSYGVITQNASEAFVKDCIIRDSTTNGINALDTSTLYQQGNIIKNTTGAAIAKDAGATIGYGNNAITYSASMTPDATSGTVFEITATNGTAFTINAPTKGNLGQIITLTIKNGSGGALGAITWDGAYYKSAWTNPANGQNRSVSFKFTGSAWVQISQTGVDVPN